MSHQQQAATGILLVMDWKQIKSTHYSISNHGLVRNDKTKKILSPRIRRDGYSMVGLYDGRGTPKNVQAHRLVAQYFLPPPSNPLKIQVNHIDGNPSNNHVSNLEWVTPKENSQHAVKTGLFPRCGSHHLAKLSDNDVLQIRELYRDGLNQYQIAIKFNVNQSVISRYITRARGGAYR